MENPEQDPDALALLEPGGGMALLAAQARGLHDIAMWSMDDAEAASYRGAEYHRAVIHATRCCTIFMRQLDSLARERARKRAAETGDGAALDAAATAPPAIDHQRLAELIVDELAAQGLMEQEFMNHDLTSRSPAPWNDNGDDSSAENRVAFTPRLVSDSGAGALAGTPTGAPATATPHQDPAATAPPSPADAGGGAAAAT